MTLFCLCFVLFGAVVDFFCVFFFNLKSCAFAHRLKINHSNTMFYNYSTIIFSSNNNNNNEFACILFCTSNKYIIIIIISQVLMTMNWVKQNKIKKSSSSSSKKREIRIQQNWRQSRQQKRKKNTNLHFFQLICILFSKSEKITHYNKFLNCIPKCNATNTHLNSTHFLHNYENPKIWI